MKTVCMLAVCVFAVGCGSMQPVLYPNDHLSRVGHEQSQRDIDTCCRQAEEYVKKNPSGDVARDTAVGGTIGAATGAAAGAVWGHVGRGAAAGAAGGATAGAVRGMFRAKDPGPVYKNFVNRCLKEKGYETIGWE